MMKGYNFKLVLFLLLILWVAVILYFSSQSPGTSDSQSRAAVKVIKAINDVFDISDTAFYERVAGFFRDTRLFEPYTTPHAVVRKGAHFGIYFLLGAIAAGFGYVYSRKIFIGFLLGVCLPVTVAVADEFNQGLVGRRSSLDDVVIDGVGALTGSVLAVLVIVLVRVVLFLVGRFRV